MARISKAGTARRASIWSVKDGAMKGSNAEVVPTSTYLFTNNNHRNFRLLFDVKQSIFPAHSGMHSAVAALGERFTDQGNNAHGFHGPLLMFGNDWGIWDAYRRNRIVPQGSGAQAEKRGDWNLVEILGVGTLMAENKLLRRLRDETGELHQAIKASAPGISSRNCARSKRTRNSPSRPSPNSTNKAISHASIIWPASPSG